MISLSVIPRHFGRHGLTHKRIFFAIDDSITTPGISSRTDSTSTGETLTPPTLIASDSRPRKCKYSPRFSTLSPVQYHPLESNGEGALRYPSIEVAELTQRIPSGFQFVSVASHFDPHESDVSD
jgi:hypothetical protein